MPKKLPSQGRLSRPPAWFRREKEAAANSARALLEKRGVSSRAINTLVHLVSSDFVSLADAQALLTFLPVEELNSFANSLKRPRKNRRDAAFAFIPLLVQKARAIKAQRGS